MRLCLATQKAGLVQHDWNNALVTAPGISPSLHSSSIALRRLHGVSASWKSKARPCWRRYCALAKLKTLLRCGSGTDACQFTMKQSSLLDLMATTKRTLLAYARLSQFTALGGPFTANTARFSVFSFCSVKLQQTSLLMCIPGELGSC